MGGWGVIVLGWYHTVDGQNPAPPENDDYPIIYRDSTIPGGAGFHPSRVGLIGPLIFLLVGGFG